MQPYIGITGFVARSEVDETLNYFKSLGLPERRLMVGVLVSYKSRHGLPMKPEWAFKYPDPTEINDIFRTDSRALNLIHYNSREPGLCDQLLDLLELVPNCDGFQLNIAWPDPAELARFRRLQPDKVIVLQIGSRAFAEVGQRLGRDLDFDKLSDIKLASQKIMVYWALIDYFLPDLSGGVGKPMNHDFMGALIGAMMQYQTSPMPVVGGGLESGNVAELIRLLRLQPQLSWDAEGRLFQGDRLDLGKCLAYLQASASVIESAWHEDR